MEIKRLTGTRKLNLDFDALGRQISRGYRNLRRLFHMLVGLAFLICAVAGAAVSLAEWKLYVESPSVGLVRFDLLAGFTVLLVILGMYSFLKARSVK